MTVGQGSAPSAQIAQFRSDGVTAATGLRIPFFTDAFSRAFGFPDVLPMNMIAEETPLREERPFAAYVGLREVHYGRPGLVTGYNLGAGPDPRRLPGAERLWRRPFRGLGQTAYNVAHRRGLRNDRWDRSRPLGRQRGPDGARRRRRRPTSTTARTSIRSSRAPCRR